jgi:hypothetical protein
MVAALSERLTVRPTVRPERDGDLSTVTTVVAPDLEIDRIKALVCDGSPVWALETLYRTIAGNK